MPEISKQHAWTQTVTTNKTTVETFFVLLTAMWIVAISATVINFNQVSHAHAHHLAKNEISLRYDLTSNEQGIFSDLLLVYQGWLTMDSSESTPDIATLVDDEWPPFTDVSSRKNRGSHIWKKGNISGSIYYLGISQNTEIARHFLWVTPQSNKGLTAENFTVWLLQNGTPNQLTNITSDYLGLNDWKKINPSSEIHKH